MTSFLHKKINTKGFTLVEILVVLGLFSFIMTLATGVLYTTQAVNIKLQETQSVLDNVNLSIETISRDIRYGSEFHCGNSVDEVNSHLRKNCSFENGGGTVLFFKPSEGSGGERVSYYATTTSQGDVILKDEYAGGGTSTYQITARDVKIKSLIFYVSGANTASSTGEDVGNAHDFQQPIITLTISGETIPTVREMATSTQRATSTKFTMQSSVSPRELDK